MYEKALLIYNQNAGQQEIEETLAMIIPKLAPSIHELTLKQTESKGDAEQYCIQYGEQIDLLLIMGGDGTVHECVNGLLQQAGRPIVAILPTGTCNDLARALNCFSIEEAVEAILAKNKRTIDVVQQNERFFANFSGVGLISDASKEISTTTKDKFGKLGYAISAFRSMIEPSSFTYTLQLEGGEKKSGEAVMILAMNGQYLGTFGFFKDITSLSDGKLHIFIVKEAGFSLLKSVYQQATGTDELFNNPEQIEVVTTVHGTLETSRELDIDSDGEITDQTPVTYKLFPKELTFITKEV
ncbi:hypothetical protein AB990_07970 [Alkalihalobacillus pseudalcaliphilus]|nr:hypothetical protein AB990_07970 [Alkalihalobacillus pseudalcaliphilus]